jgi:hypothetical protein
MLSCKSEWMCGTCPMNFGLNSHPSDTPDKLVKARSDILKVWTVDDFEIAEKHCISIEGARAVISCVELNLDGEDCY